MVSTIQHAFLQAMGFQPNRPRLFMEVMNREAAKLGLQVLFHESLGWGVAVVGGKCLGKLPPLNMRFLWGVRGLEWIIFWFYG